MQTCIGAALIQSRHKRIALSFVAAGGLWSQLAIVNVDDLLFAVDLHLNFVIAAVLLVAIISRADEDGGASFGLVLQPALGWWYWTKFGAAAGALVGLAGVLSAMVYLLMGYAIPSDNFAFVAEGPMRAFCWMCISAPLQEEVVYRLLFGSVLVAWTGPVRAIILSGAIFAAAHFVYGNAGIDNFVAGYIFGWAYLRSGSLLVPLAFHSVGNFAALLVQLAYLRWFV